jgi:hypothetical protein
VEHVERILDEDVGVFESLKGDLDVDAKIMLNCKSKKRSLMAWIELDSSAWQKVKTELNTKVS